MPIAYRPRGLAEILEILEPAAINIEYMYAFAFRREDQAIMVFRFEDPDEAIGVLQSRGVNVVNKVELFERAAG